MTIEQVIDVLENEKECVIRNINNECNRDCSKCDLLLPDSDIVNSYNYVLDVLNEMKAREE